MPIPPTLIIRNEDAKHVVGSKSITPRSPRRRWRVNASSTLPATVSSSQFYATGDGFLHCERDARTWPDDTPKWLRKVLSAFGK